MSTPSPFVSASADPPAGDTARTQQHTRRVWLLIGTLLISILLVGASGVWWWLHARHRPAVHGAAGIPQDTLQSSGTNASGSTPGHYVSRGSDLNLAFTYPGGWSTDPPSDGDTNDQPITVTSPLFTTTGANGEQTTAKIIVSIRPGGTRLDELNGDKTTVTQTSDQIAYTSPTAAQHQYPYLTFMRTIGGSSPANGFDEAIITGSIKFAKGQGVVEQDLSSLDPVISARFYSCSDTACASTAPLIITAATWQQDSSFQAVLALFQSLQLH